MLLLFTTTGPTPCQVTWIRNSFFISSRIFPFLNAFFSFHGHPSLRKFQHPHLLVPLLSTPATVLLNLSFSVRQPLFHGGSGSRFKLRQHSLRTPFSSGPHQLPSSSQRQLIMVGSLTINYSTSREADAQSVVDDTLFKGIGVPSENG